MKSIRLLLGFLLTNIFNVYGMNKLTTHVSGSWYDLETDIKMGIIAHLSVQDKESMRLVNKKLGLLASREQFPQMIQFPCVLDRSNHLQFMVEFSKKRDTQAHNIMTWLIDNAQSCGHADVLAIVPHFFPTVVDWNSLVNAFGNGDFSSVSKSDLCAVISVCGHMYPKNSQKRKQISRFIISEIMDIYSGSQSAIDRYMKKYHQGKEISTHLHEAIKVGHPTVVELFLMQNPHLLCIADHRNMVPLAIALEKNNEEIIELIMSCIRRHKIIQKKDIPFSKLPWVCAARAGNRKVLPLLLEPNNQGWSPLCCAACVGDEELVQLLLDNGAELQNSTLSPLMMAVQTGHFAIVKKLVEHSSATINDMNDEGVTVLFSAIAAKRKDIVEFLLDNGALVNMCMKYQKMPPLMFAVSVGDLAIVELLVQKGAHINYQAKNKTTALSLAISKEHTDIINFLLSQQKIIIR